MQACIGDFEASPNFISMMKPQKIDSYAIVLANGLESGCYFRVLSAVSFWLSLLPVWCLWPYQYGLILSQLKETLFL